MEERSSSCKEIPSKVQRDLYLTMLKIRKFELKVAELFGEQEMRSPTHLYTGHEAVATGVISAIRKKDPVIGYYRSHGYYLAKGGDPKAMIVEFYVKATGANKGKGGSLLLSGPKYGYLGSTAIVSGGIPVATGIALAAKLKKNDLVTVCFFGDAATEEGSFYECLNFAALKKLPIIYVCENNLYAVQSPISARQALPDQMNERSKIFGIPGMKVDGNDVEEVYSTAKTAFERARSGGGPTFIEALTYRWHEHVGPGFDTDWGWRPKHELEAWKVKDPVAVYGGELVSRNILSQAEMKKMGKDIDKMVDAAFRFAKKSPLPKPEELLRNVY